MTEPGGGKGKGQKRKKQQKPSPTVANNISSSSVIESFDKIENPSRKSRKLAKEDNPGMYFMGEVVLKSRYIHHVLVFLLLF